MDKFLDLVISDDIEKVSEILAQISLKGDSSTTEQSSGDFHDFQIGDLEDALVEAAYAGALRCLKALHEFVPDLNCRGRLRDSCPDYYIPPLRAAVERDRVETVHWLCSNGANPNRKECLYSIDYNDVISGLYFSNHCAVSCYVPLHFAQSRACVDLLLDHGADINVQDCMSKTPLSMATLDGRVQVIEALCKRGARLELGSKWGATPLVYAQYARNKQHRVTATEILCRYGADVNVQDKNGRTPLHVVRDIECLRMLLSHGADPSKETILGKTPIVSAAENELWPLVWMLCDAQPRINLGLISRGVALFHQLPLNALSMLLRTSNKVRDLKHLTRCVIRESLMRRRGNVDETITALPLPTRVKLYLALLNHVQEASP